MAKDYEFRQICWRCKGEGKYTTTVGETDRFVDPCKICEGKGYVVKGYMVKK